MKRILSIILAAVLIISAFTILPLTASAKETDVADTGAEADLSASGSTYGKSVNTLDDLKYWLEYDDPNNTWRISVTANITANIDVTPYPTSTENYIPIWCTIKGNKIIDLQNHTIRIKSGYSSGYVHAATRNWDYILARSNQCLFSVPKNASLEVNAYGSVTNGKTAAGIVYEGALYGDYDAVDQRDIFHVDGGSLTVFSGGYYTPDVSRKFVSEDSVNGDTTRWLQVNGSAVTVNSGTCKIYGGYFEGRGFDHYLDGNDIEADSYRNGALEIYGGSNSKVTVYGGYFFGTDHGCCMKHEGVRTNTAIYSGTFELDTAATHYGTAREAIQSYEGRWLYGYTTTKYGVLGIPLRSLRYVSFSKYANYYSFTMNGSTPKVKTLYNNYIIDLSTLKEKYFAITPRAKANALGAQEPTQELIFMKDGMDYDYSSDGYLPWNGSSDLIFDIDRSSFYFSYPVIPGNSLDVSGYHSLSVTIREHISDGNRPVVAENVSVPWSEVTSKLSFNLNKIDSSVRAKLKPGHHYDFDFAEMESYSGNLSTFFIDHDGFIAVYIPQTYTVSFDSNGGFGIMRSVTVEDGASYTIPSCNFVPFSGNEFDYWRDQEGKTYHPGDKITVTKDITLYAKWTQKTYAVSFDLNGHGDGVMPEIVRHGDKAIKPADPTATGWTFGGWYKEKTCKNAYDFDTPVTADITLYAKWTQKTYTVSFDLNGHGDGAMQLSVRHGDKAIKPADPIASGWTFGGWYKEKTCKNAYDFDTPVTANLTLYAKWTQKTILLGDADGDGKVTVIDATRIQKKLASISVLATFNEKAADVDKSGKLEITDATNIQKYLAHISVKYKIGDPMT